MAAYLSGIVAANMMVTVFAANGDPLRSLNVAYEISTRPPTSPATGKRAPHAAATPDTPTVLVVESLTTCKTGPTPAYQWRATATSTRAENVAAKPVVALS